MKCLINSQVRHSACSRKREVSVENKASRIEADAPTNLWTSHPQNVKKSFPKEAFLMTSQEGFEPPTDGLEGRCSILLSY